MLVGIIDIDLFINKKTFLPNPEVMLYSAYHKQNKDIVHLLMDGKNIDMYDKIYIFRNRMSKVKFPEELYSRKNVTCRGCYFTNGVVMPTPEEVFKCTPDKTIYDKYCNYWGTVKPNGVVTLKEAKYISLRNGFPPQSGRGAVYLYDYDLGGQEDFEKLSELYQKGYFKKLHFCHPIQCKTIDEAIQWSQATFVTVKTRIVYPKCTKWEEIYKVRKIKPHLPIETYITEKKRFSSEKEIDELIINTMNKILYCIINQVPILFKLNPKIKITEQFLILKRMSEWSCAKKQGSFMDFIKSDAKMRPLVEIFLRQHPDVKDWFTINPHEYKNNGGIWLNDRRTN